MIPIQQILVRCTEEQLESILSSCQTIMSHMQFAPVTHPYSSLEITSSTGKFTAWIALCLRSLQPAHRAKHCAIRTRWWSELGGETLLFHDGAQVLPDDEHSYLLYDCRRSIYFDYQVWGVPSKRSFPLTSWGPRKLSICGERRNHSKFKRACSFGLACAFRRGRALQGFTSSALLHNTVALPIPNAFEKNCIFLQFMPQN